jgi:radical SAM protein with 4Fe4S-binding SPASM domain
LLPYVVDIDLTDNCNLSCMHCNRFPQVTAQKMLTKQQLFSLIDELYDLGVANLFLGGGEPSCRQNWVEIIAYACSKVGLSVTLATNGITLSSKDINILAKLVEPPRFAVSLDGYSPETYGILRRISNNSSAGFFFYRIIKNIQNLISKGFFVCVNIVVTNETKNIVTNMIKLAGELGAQSILLIKFVDIALNSNTKVSLSDDVWNEIISDVTRRKIQGQIYFDRVAVSVTCPWEIGLPLKTNGFNFEISKKYWYYDICGLKNSNLSCTAGAKCGGIDCYGNVYPCSVTPTGCRSLIAGNVQKTTFEKIWNGAPILRKMRSLTQNSLDALGCGSCPELTWCGGGCRIRALLNSGSLSAADPSCPLAKKAIDDEKTRYYN